MIEGAIDGFSESEVYDDFWSENAPTVQSFETNCNGPPGMIAVSEPRTDHKGTTF
jgi:hypothetical protein